MKDRLQIICIALLAMLSASAYADDAVGYPVETVQWGEVTDSQRSVIERLMADLVMVPAGDETRAVWMGRYEVTQDAWLAVTGDSTRWDVQVGDSLPAHSLSWNEAQQFIVSLRKLTGKHFRMPTVQEWQFAAKGGENFTYAGSDVLDNVGWYQDNCDFVVHLVGQKHANGYGLYDMSGNVPEWCSPDSTMASGFLPLCGGGYWMDAEQCAIANVSEQTSASAMGGLRIVLDPINEAEQRVLVVTQADGTREQYPLSLQPKITLAAPNLVIDANGERHEYELAQMARMSYVTPAAAVRGRAQEEPIDVEGRANAIYTFRNDGDFNAFLNIDVDSIVYSRLGVDSLEYNAAVTQEVWTPDTVYRIPLAAVDSIGFHTPKPVFRPDVFHIGEWHLTYIESVDGLKLTFNSYISADSLPSVGQVILSDVCKYPIRKGFAGRVKSIEHDGNSIVVSCEGVTPLEVFDRFVSVGYTMSTSAEKARSRRATNSSGGNVDDVEWDDVKEWELGSFNIHVPVVSDLVELWGGVDNPEFNPDDKTVDNFADLTITPKFKIYHAVNIQFGGHSYAKWRVDYDITKKVSFELSCSAKAKKDGHWVLDPNSFDKNIPDYEEREAVEIFRAWTPDLLAIPIIPGVLYADLSVGAEISLNGSIKLKANLSDKTKGAYEFSWDSDDMDNPSIRRIELPQEAYDEADDGIQKEAELSVNGSIGASALLDLGFFLFSDNVLAINNEFGAGVELSANISLSTNGLKDDSWYSALKNTGVTITPLKLFDNIKFAIAGKSFKIASWSKSFWKKEYKLFPDFTEPAFTPPAEYIYNGPSLFPTKIEYPAHAVYTVPSKDVSLFFFQKIGVGVYDQAGNQLYSQFAEPSYMYEKDWEKPWAYFDVSKLTPGEKYEFRPLMRLWGLEFLEISGMPRSLIYIPTGMKLDRNSVTLDKGTSAMVEILDGWGSYEVTCPEDNQVATATTLDMGKRHYVLIKAITPGKVSVVVKDFYSVHEEVIDITVKGSIGDLKLENDTYQLTIGEQQTVNILNGSGQYTITSSDVNAVTASVEGNVITIEVIGTGDAIVTVKDVVTGSSAQISIVNPISTNTYAMKYWFDDQKELAGTIESLSAIEQIDVSGLSDGLHALHVTVCEDFEYLGHYETAPQTVYFIKEGQKTDIRYDYYVDGKKIMDSNTKTVNTHTAYLPMMAIDEGLHRLTTVATLTGTDRTTMHNDFFVRASNNSEDAGMRLMVSIDDAAPTILKRAPVDGSLSYDLDISGLAPGLHRLNYQVASNGTKGVNTPPRTSFFVVDQKLDGYEYTLNGDPQTLVKVGNLHADSPYDLVTELPVQAMPLRSSKFHFAVEDGQPCVYGVTDLNMRINDEFGAHVDSTLYFIDVNVRQPLENVTALEKNMPSEVNAPGKDVIRWFSLDAYRGDGICLEANHPCTLQLFAPDGEKIYSASGEQVTTASEVNGRQTGTYYVALHDMGSEDEGTVAVTWHAGNSILTEAVTASPATTSVYKGREVALSCATPNAVIWYSTDGSKPMLESERTHKYESPIVVNDDMVLRAYATCKDMLASDEMGYRISVARLDRQQQLKKGWNWVSVNSTTGEPMGAMTFLQPLEGNVKRVLAQTEELIYDPACGLIGNLSELSPSEGYRLQLKKNATYSWTGIARLPSLMPIQLYNGWNWIGFLPAAAMTVDQAFAGFTPSEGDCVVGQKGFSTYTGEGWTGTLVSMAPGQAYHYHSAVTTQMAYTDELPNDNVASQQAPLVQTDSIPWQYDAYAYPDVTAVIARLEPGGLLPVVADCVVGAFCGDECRGVGRMVDGLLFISVYASADEVSLINFRAFDTMTAQEIVLDEHMMADGQLHGTYSQPMLLHATGTTTAASVGAERVPTFNVYSLTGILVRRNATSLKGLKPGIYVINGRTVKL